MQQKTAEFRHSVSPHCVLQKVAAPEICKGRTSDLPNSEHFKAAYSCGYSTGFTPVSLSSSLQWPIAFAEHLSQNQRSVAEQGAGRQQKCPAVWMSLKVRARGLFSNDGFGQFCTIRLFDEKADRFPLLSFH